MEPKPTYKTFTATTDATPRHTGTVKWFDKLKGYDFIIPDDDGPEISVHYSAIQGDGYRTCTMATGSATTWWTGAGGRRRRRYGRLAAQHETQMNLKSIAAGFIALLITLTICYLLTGLALTSAGYPMW